MLEIEMKFPVPGFASIEGTLKTWQAQADEAQVEADHYYNAPDRDFARTDEALRLRRIGADNIVTYKGPKQPGLTKTRTEIEVRLEPGTKPAEHFCRLLTHLGYRAVAVVRKTRREHRLTRAGFALQICLDDVEQVGQFAEVEIVAPEEKKVEAQQIILQVATELGLKDAEKRSYLEMFLAK